MKKITRRAFTVLLLAAAIIFGMTVFVLRYVDEGRDWALYFSRANAGAGGELRDRNGVVLARTALLERTAELDDVAHGFRWPHDSHGRGDPDDEAEEKNSIKPK